MALIPTTRATVSTARPRASYVFASSALLLAYSPATRAVRRVIDAHGLTQPIVQYPPTEEFRLRVEVQRLSADLVANGWMWSGQPMKDCCPLKLLPR